MVIPHLILRGATGGRPIAIIVASELAQESQVRLWVSGKLSLLHGD